MLYDTTTSYNMYGIMTDPIQWCDRYGFALNSLSTLIIQDDTTHVSNEFDNYGCNNVLFAVIQITLKFVPNKNKKCPTWGLSL